MRNLRFCNKEPIDMNIRRLNKFPIIQNVQTCLWTVSVLIISTMFSTMVNAQNVVPFSLYETEVSEIEWNDRFDAVTAGLEVIKSREPLLSANSIKYIGDAVDRYRRIVWNGGWPKVPVTRKAMKLGYQGEEVVILRERLVISGDLTKNVGKLETFDSYVEAAVRRFQWRNGLIADGIVSTQTLEVLNIPAPLRLRQLETNLLRLQELADFNKSKYVLVNIPGAEIEAVENGRVHSRHTAVVGKIDRPTPFVRSAIHQVNFNPYWTVPRSIIERDLIPIMQKDPEYLTENKIRILDWNGNELSHTDIDWYTDEAVNYQFKQDPGALNSLGSVRINFHNTHQVYLHDTPSKTLFGQDKRFHSSGCVRVQNVRGLITWLLSSKQPKWSRSHIDEVIRSGERVDVNLGNNVPILMAYITAWGNSDGVVHFRDDIYEQDIELLKSESSNQATL